MDIESTIRDIVRSEIASLSAGLGTSEPELIRIADAAKICGVSGPVIEALHHERDTNGFPSIQLGPRTVRIDKRRLQQWFETGGLGVKV